MNTKLFGLFLLIISELELCYLIFFDNYFPKWHGHIHLFNDTKYLVYERLELIITFLIFAGSIVGILLLILSNKKNKVTTIIWGIILLAPPVIISFLKLFGVIRYPNFSDLLSIYLVEYFFTFPIFIIVFFLIQVLNKKT